MKWKSITWIAVCFSAIALYVFWVAFPRPMTYHARQMIDATLDGNASRLLGYSWEHERETCQLSESKLQKVMDRLVLPRWSGFKPIGPILADTLADGDQGTAEQMMRNQVGTQVPLSFSPWRSPNGPRSSVVQDLLTRAWVVEGVFKQDIDPSPANILRAQILGLEKDRSFLEELEIPGFVGIESRSKVQTWDMLLEQWKGRLARESSTARN